MKHVLRLFICTLLMLATFTACEYKELCYDHPHNPKGKVVLDIDWSLIYELPSGVTIIFYPTDGGEPIKFVTNSTEHFETDLPEGNYNVLIFNQTENEYESLKFRNLNDWDDAYIELADGVQPSWSTRPGNYSAQPAELLIDTKQNLGITAYKVDNSSGTPTILKLQPHPVLVNTDVRVHVDGIQYARQVRGVIAGMAKRYYLTRNATGSETTSFVLPEWDINKSEEDYTKGVFFTNFISFGLPNTQYDDNDLQRASNYAKTRATVNLTEPVLLDIDVLLVDNKTILSKSFVVTDRIAIHLEELTLDVNVGIKFGDKTSTDPTTDTPLVLPQVEDADSQGGGFTVSVDDWGDEEVHDVDV